MSQNLKNNNEEQMPHLDEAISKTELFLKKNQSKIITTISVIVIAVAAYFGVKNFYLEPLKVEAQGQMFRAEQLFRAENYEAALNGDGNTLGFISILSEYGTKAGEVIYLYSGICEYQLGNFQASIDYLSKFNNKKDPILYARSLSLQGDAYVGLDQLEKAYELFISASKVADNSMTASYLLKAAVISEELGNNDEALRIYEEIKLKYSNTMEGSQIDKYIGRIKNA